MDNEKALKLLNEIYDSWTHRFNSDDGEELRLPNYREELESSRVLLDKLSQLDFDDEDLVNRFKDYDSIVTRFIEDENLESAKDVKVNELLDEMYEIWSERWNDDNYEYRLPASIEEVSKSWEIFEKIYKINCDGESTKERIQTYREFVEDFQKKNAPAQNTREEYEKDDIEKENDKPHYQNNFIRNKGRFITSILISIGMFLFAYNHMFNRANKNFPDNTYDENLFTVDKQGGVLNWNSYTEKEGQFSLRKSTKKKMTLKPGTKVKPITNLGKYSFIVELPNGQRGVINSTSLKISNSLVAQEDARIFDKIGGEVETKEKIAEGTKAVVLKRVTKGEGFMADRYVKLKLEDGRVKWSLEPYFKIDNLPKFNGRAYAYSTTKELAEKYIIGKTQKEIEDYYGIALYVDRTKRKHTIYFQGLTIVQDNENHFKGIFIDFDKKGLGSEIVYLGSGESRWMDMFPYVEKVRESELNRFLHWSFLLKFPIIGDWQKSTKDWYNGLRKYNWIMGFVVFGFDLILYVLGIILFYTLARVFVNPILQFFTYIRFINQIAILFNTIIIFVVTYAAFVILVFLEDGFFWVGSLGFLVFFRGMMKNLSNIQYNLCPECGTMYAGFNSGSSYTGRTTSVLREKFRHYTGTSADGKYQYYENRIKKTTTDTDHYLDHQSCDQCGHSWNVDREDSNTY